MTDLIIDEEDREKLFKHEHNLDDPNPAIYYNQKFREELYEIMLAKECQKWRCKTFAWCFFKNEDDEEPEIVRLFEGDRYMLVKPETD